MKDIQKLIDTLIDAKQDCEKKSLNGMVGGLDLAIDLIKLHAGMGSPLEEAVETYMVDDVHLNFEEEAI